MASNSDLSGTTQTLAVHSLHEFVFCVPDLNEAAHFYSSFGLDVRNENRGRAPSRQTVKKTQPLYLSHILMFTADTLAATAFYEQVLGLKLSDRSQHVIAFLHTPHGSAPHLIALALSDGPGLHHSSWCGHRSMQWRWALPKWPG
jgi:catechol 2,3-dioxygenase-like lactoylglutathione lyase family enzyme